MRARLVSAALAAGLLAVVALGAAGLARPQPSSAFEPGGLGAWPFVADAHEAGLQVRRTTSSPAAALRDVDAQRTVLAVFDAPIGYAAQDAAAVEAFLRAGGNLLVADPFGAAGQLLSSVGLAFERVRLVDPLQQERPVQVQVAGGSFEVGWSLPSAIRLGEGVAATVLAASNDGSFLDRNGDGVIDVADPQGSFPLAVEAVAGRGRVVAVADGGLFAGRGAHEADNEAFRRALLDHLLPGGGTVLIDESRAGVASPALAALSVVTRQAASAPWSWVLLGLTALALAVPLLPGALRIWKGHVHRPDRFIRRDAATQRGTAGPPPAGWTPRGWGLVSATLALLAGGLVTGSGAALGAAGLGLVLLAVAFVHSPGGVEGARRLEASRPAEGAPVSVELRLRSTRRRPVAAEVADLLPEEFDVRAGQAWFAITVPPGEGARVTYEAVPALRGPYLVGPLVARTRDALGLRVHSVLVASADAVQVAPRQEPVRRIPFTTKVPTVTLGPHFVNRAGEGSEFHALREYVQGDAMRSVNWKASARSSALMVNQRVHESMTRLLVLLDRRHVSGVGPASRTPLAVGCRASLSIAAAALRVRDRIAVAAYGDGLLRLPDAPGSRQLHQLRELLSALPAKGSTGLLAAVEELSPSLRPRTPVLVVSGLEADPSFVEGVRTLRNRGALPLVVATPIDVRPAGGPPEEGAVQIEAEREAALRAVRALGVPVYETAQGLPLDDLFRLGGGA